MTYRLAILGPPDVTSMFRATGADIFAAESGTQALDILRDIKKNTLSSDPALPKHAIVMVIESLLENIRLEDYEKVSTGALPAIIAVPGLSGTTGASLRKLKKLAERAVGFDVVK